MEPFLKTVANQTKMNRTFIGICYYLGHFTVFVCGAHAAYLVSFVNLFKSVVIPY